MRCARYALFMENVGVGQAVAEALGRLLSRDVRMNLYQQLTENLGEAVDAVTYPVLSGLARTGPVSAAELAAQIGLDRSGVTRRATRLEEAGLLRREPHSEDGRVTLLVLTDAGDATVQRMRERLAAAIETSMQSWPDGEAEAFAVSLRRFVDGGPFRPDSARSA